MKKHFSLFLKGFQLPEINSFLLRNALIKNLSKFIQCAVILTNRKSGWILTEPYYVLLYYYFFCSFRFCFSIESAFNRNIEFILPSRIPISACCQFIECLCRVISVKHMGVCADENISRRRSSKVRHTFNPHFCM